MSGFEKMVFVITYQANQKNFDKKNQKSKIEIKINFFFICLILFTNTQECR
jgi:hypothetical protein